MHVSVSLAQNNRGPDESLPDNLFVPLGNYSPKEGEYFLNKGGICQRGILATRYYCWPFLFISIVV
jgi:hypothetical protein